MSYNHRTAEVFEFRQQGEYATFIIDSTPSRHTLAIESSFGGYAYCWGNPGPDFKDFLVRIGIDYVLSKMVGADRVFDGDGTTLNIRKAILQTRRRRLCTAEEAREIWPWNLDSEVDFSDWVERTEIVNDSGLNWDWDPLSFYSTCGGRRTQEFTALYKMFWPKLAEALKPPELVQKYRDVMEEWAAERAASSGGRSGIMALLPQEKEAEFMCRCDALWSQMTAVEQKEAEALARTVRGEET